MTQRLADIQQQLMATFFEEAREALSQIENGLLRSEITELYGIPLTAGLLATFIPPLVGANPEEPVVVRIRPTLAPLFTGAAGPNGEFAELKIAALAVEMVFVNTQEVLGRYFWRVMPRTYLVAEARLGKADYRVNTANNNTDTRLLAGITWEATAKTTGQFKIGRQQKSFDNASKPDASGGTFETSVEWKPLTYSVFTLVANRSAADALVAGAAYHHIARRPQPI